MPQLTPDGYRVLLFKTFEHSEKDLPPSGDYMLKAHLVMTDLLMKFDRHKGIITVFDVRHVSRALVQLTMTFLPKLIEVSKVGTKIYNHNVAAVELLQKLCSLFPSKSIFITLQCRF